MARETNNRGLRAMRHNGSGGLFGISDMYRNIVSSRMLRMARTDLLPTIPSGPEIDETHDNSQEANTAYSSDDGIESADVRRNANIQTERTYGTDKSPGIRQTNDSLISSPKIAASQYQSYASTNSCVSASTELQHDGTPEKYANSTKSTIPEMHNNRFLGNVNSSYKETSKISGVGKFSTSDNEIRETTNVGNIQKPKSCEGCRFLQKDAKKLFPGSGLSSALETKIGRKLEAAGGARETFQTTGKCRANERSQVEISRNGSSYNSPIGVHRGSLHVCRNEEENGRFVVKGQSPAKAELDRYSSSRARQELGIIYPDINKGVWDGSETRNKITEGRNEEFIDEMKGNAGASILQQTPEFSEIPYSRNMQEATWWHTPANQSLNNNWVAPSGLVCSGCVNVGCAGTCGGGNPDGCSGRSMIASCAPAIIPRGVGFPKHARMFGASMPYKNKGLPGDVGNCGISLLPRVCRTARCRHGACHRGYVHPIIRTIPDSRADGIPRCRAKARGKKRRQTTDTAVRFPCDFNEEKENRDTCTYENVELDNTWPSPIPGAFLNTPEAEGIGSAPYEESRDNEYEPTPQTSQLTTRKKGKNGKKKT